MTSAVKITTIALDLEGTLISNAVSQFPRPGLKAFLDFCQIHFQRVVLYTAVPTEVCMKIQSLLVSEGVAPSWFVDVPYVQWDHCIKDLTNVPGTAAEATLLVDDNPDYVLPNQRNQWIHAAKFEPPYSDDDTELKRIQPVIMQRIGYS